MILLWLGAFVLAVFTLFVLAISVCHYCTSVRKYWRIKNVPYREPCPIFGNFGAALTMRRSYASTLQYFYETYKLQRFVGIFQARRPTLMVIDLDIVKNIFSTDFNNFSDRISVSTDIRREPLLRNLANMSGSEWKAMRQIVTPSFSSAKMKAMFPLVKDCARMLSSVLKEECSVDINVPKLLVRYTTDVIGSCAFGVDPRSLRDLESPFLVMSQKMFKVSRSTIAKRYCRAYFPRLFKFLNLTSYSSDVETFITTTIKSVLTERRSTGSQRPDFLQLMLNVQKNESALHMTDELITSNSFIFMLAGLETSSTTMSFCLYELAKRKELQDDIRKEILAVLEKHGELNYEAVNDMHLAKQALLETLRLHPPTPFTTRLCTTPCTLAGTELYLNKKDPVIIPIQCIQKDEKHFPDPERFDPERFRDDSKPSGFMAFGIGPRSCPGERFAELLMVTGLSEILRAYEVEPCSKTTAQIQYEARSVLLKNKGSIWLRFKSI